jgi:hypothetical protein
MQRGPVVLGLRFGPSLADQFVAQACFVATSDSEGVPQTLKCCPLPGGVPPVPLPWKWNDHRRPPYAVVLNRAVCRSTGRPTRNRPQSRYEDDLRYGAEHDLRRRSGMLKRRTTERLTYPASQGGGAGRASPGPRG